MHLRILIPMYRMIDVQAAKSMFELQANLFKRGDTVSLAMTNHADIAKARNGLIATIPNESDIDYVLMIDSDMTYTIDTLDALITSLEENNLKMLSAMYYVRNSVNVGRKIAMCNYDEESKAYVKITPNEADKGIQQCDTVGLGFCVIKPELVVALREEYGKQLFKWQEMGEDSYFCKLIRDMGETVQYNADIKAGHISQVINI